MRNRKNSEIDSDCATTVVIFNIVAGKHWPCKEDRREMQTQPKTALQITFTGRIDSIAAGLYLAMTMIRASGMIVQVDITIV